MEQPQVFFPQFFSFLLCILIGSQCSSSDFWRNVFAMRQDQQKKENIINFRHIIWLTTFFFCFFELTKKRKGWFAVYNKYPLCYRICLIFLSGLFRPNVVPLSYREFAKTFYKKYPSFYGTIQQKKNISFFLTFNSPRCNFRLPTFIPSFLSVIMIIFSLSHLSCLFLRAWDRLGGFLFVVSPPHSLVSR